MSAEFEEKIDYKFKNPQLLATAFVHRSFVNESKTTHEHNERLEFLGDAVIELAVTTALFQRFPEKPEGELTALRSALVKGVQLAEIARRLEIGRWLKLSKGEACSGGAEKPYLLANAFEAVIGAVYLDAGFPKAQKLIEQLLLPELDQIIASGGQTDAKSNFQELAQARLAATPEYKVLAESGPDHAKKFRMGAYVGGQLFGSGNGESKQAAEQAAAKQALKKLQQSSSGETKIG